VFSLILDGTDCPIARPAQDVQREFYTGKTKKHCIKYEVGVHPHTGALVWVGGPFPGRTHDITMTRQSGLLNYIKGTYL
jgi:hypothetical protein